MSAGRVGERAPEVPQGIRLLKHPDHTLYLDVLSYSQPFQVSYTGLLSLR